MDRVESHPGRKGQSSPSQLTLSSGPALRVLVATDGSAFATRAAEFVSKMVGAGTEVRLVTVLSFEFYPHSFWGPPLSDEVDRMSTVARLEAGAFAEVEKILRSTGATVSNAHRFGRVVGEILEEATEWHADLIVVGRQGLTGPSRWVLGSVSESLVTHSKVPVLIVP